MRRALFACLVTTPTAVVAGCATGDTFLEGPVPARSQQRTRVPVTGTPPPPAAPAAGKAPGVDEPPLAASDTPLPINLATALRLANARPIDVQIVGQQVAAAAAGCDRARALRLPGVSLGTDSSAPSGLQQASAGGAKSHRNPFMTGFGPNVVFSFSDALYAPLAARQEPDALRTAPPSTANDVTQAVAEAYFGVQQARGTLAGALAAEAYAEELVRKAAGSAAEHEARAELGRCKPAVAAARERWRTSSAELARLLRLGTSAVVEPAEPALLPVTVIDPAVTVEELIPLALTTRPELAGNQAFVQATLAQLKQKNLRPLVPSFAVRNDSPGASGFAGAPNAGGDRFNVDPQLLREFSARGFGPAHLSEGAAVELFRTQDRIADEVATAFAQVRASAQQLNAAEPALREATDRVQKSGDGAAGAAIQAFARSNADFFAAVADYNRAQFRLYRALGHPTRCLAGAVPLSAPAPIEPLAPDLPLAPQSSDTPQPAPIPTMPPPPAEPDLLSLPAPEWTSVPGLPLTAEKHGPIVVEERRGGGPETRDGK